MLLHRWQRSPGCKPGIEINPNCDRFTEMVTQDEIDTFAADGVICLRQKIDPKWIEVLAQGFERNLEEPGPYATSYSPPDDPGGYLDDLMNWARIPQYRDFVFESPAARIAGELTRSSHCRILLENMLIKEPGTTQASPWHQDQPYYTSVRLKIE